jgi:carbamoyl-phosphate synthase small subunit
MDNGAVFIGNGFGFVGTAVGELCFNTAISGYQEILTDPSYYGQIVTFTFPHIGNTGINAKDSESSCAFASGMVLRNMPTRPSNWQSEQSLQAYLEQNEIVALWGVDTRRISRMIRDGGMLKSAITFDPSGNFNPEKLLHLVRNLPEMSGRELASLACSRHREQWNAVVEAPTRAGVDAGRVKVVAMDFGMKISSVHMLQERGCKVAVLPANATFDDIMREKPQGVFLSNGPGDPVETAKYASPVIRRLVEETHLPIFGICLGHQLLALALGAKTEKILFGHHGSNHPVKDLQTNQVSITSMNHGFAVVADTFPDSIEQTHVSLFDGSNCGLRVKNRPIFSVQYHPEAHPGPLDSLALFDDFVSSIRRAG